MHNFWTTERIRHGSEYRLRVSRGDGITSEAVTPIPPDFPVTVAYPRPNPSALVILAVEHLAMVQVRKHVDPACPQWNSPQSYALFSFTTAYRSGGAQMVSVSPNGRVETPCRILRTEIFVVASGRPWGLGSAFSASALPMLDAPSDITNAVGLFHGVVSKSIPWENCTWTSNLECPITYDARSATLSGRVTNLDCGGDLPYAVVQLTEVLSTPGAIPRTRTATTALDGTFRISALDPGVKHAVRVSHPARTLGGVPPPSTLLELVGDTLTFAPAQQAVIEPGMRMRFPQSCVVFDPTQVTALAAPAGARP